MELPAPRPLTLVCAQCQRAAAEIALWPATVTSKRAGGRDRIERTEFLGTLTRFGPTPELVALFEAVGRGDFEAARAIDTDFVAFHCRGCGQNYCDTCWQLSAPEFDEGFYDYRRGTCPRGHAQVVDD